MMQKRQSLMVVAVFCFAVAPAFAQHPAHGGTGGGAGGSHGPAMSNGAADHGTTTGTPKSSASEPTGVLAKNTKLDTTLTSKLQEKGLIPAGTDLKTECSGFKNLGQCMASIHVSHNLKIPFACLRADMTGTAPTGTTCPAGTGSSKMSLGKSIQALSPNADAKAEEKSAKEQADADLKEAETNS
jgi:hypothetical protein